MYSLICIIYSFNCIMYLLNLFCRQSMEELVEVWRAVDHAQPYVLYDLYNVLYDLYNLLYDLSHVLIEPALYTDNLRRSWWRWEGTWTMLNLMVITLWLYSLNCIMYSVNYLMHSLNLFSRQSTEELVEVRRDVHSLNCIMYSMTCIMYLLNLLFTDNPRRSWWRWEGTWTMLWPRRSAPTESTANASKKC